MSQDQDGISLPVPSFGACPGRAAISGENTSSNSVSGGGDGGGSGGACGIPAAGTFWQDSVVGGGGLSPTPGSCPMDGGGLLSTGKSCKSRPVTVAYVVNGEANQQNNSESMALQSLKDACEAVGSRLETVNFGKLDFGETTVLDSFYNAGESAETKPPTHPKQSTSTASINRNSGTKLTGSLSILHESDRSFFVRFLDQSSKSFA